MARDLTQLQVVKWYSSFLYNVVYCFLIALAQASDVCAVKTRQKKHNGAEKDSVMVNPHRGKVV